MYILDRIWRKSKKKGYDIIFIENSVPNTAIVALLYPKSDQSTNKTSFYPSHNIDNDLWLLSQHVVEVSRAAERTQTTIAKKSYL